MADVEHGYDGNLYFADYGGGWSVNKNGSIQVLRPTDPKLKEVGAETARMFQKGFASRSLPELALLLDHPDQRVRQATQFAIVEKGVDAVPVFAEIIRDGAKSEYAVLHALWGLGQLYRQGWKGLRMQLSMPCLQRIRKFGQMPPGLRETPWLPKARAVS